MNRQQLAQASIAAKASSDAMYEAATAVRAADTKSIEADLDAMMARPIEIARSIIAKSVYDDVLTDDAGHCHALGFAAPDSRLCIYGKRLSYQTLRRPWGWGPSRWIDPQFYTGSDREIAANVRAALREYGQGHVPRERRKAKKLRDLYYQISMIEMGAQDV